MKSDKRILTAFLLNLGFSVFEFFGGIYSGSVSVLSDSLHDFGDAAGIGVAYWFERKSKKGADEKFTYGYARYSVIGSVITTVILLVGSLLVITSSIKRLFNPIEINYNGMIVIAIIGTVVNLGAALFTSGGKSINQKAINLHMLEDVLGWIAVLISAVVMRFTDWWFIDPILSAVIAVIIFVGAAKAFKEAVDLLLEKAPVGVDRAKLEEKLNSIESVKEIHHLHIWSLDGITNCATMHIVTNADASQTKESIRNVLKEFGISHSTLELEAENEICAMHSCERDEHSHAEHHHHHHHHH